MGSATKKPFWNKTRVALATSVITAVSLIGAAFVTGFFSKNEAPSEKQELISSPQLESGTQNNTNNQLKQENNNTGDVKNEFISGDKKTNNIFNPKPEIKNIDTPKNVEIIGKNINTGTNNGIIGDNATINAPIQPHPSKDDVLRFNDLIPDKNTPIEISYEMGNTLSTVFGREFIKLLIDDGYTDVRGFVRVSGGNLNLSTNPKGILIMDFESQIKKFFINF